MKRCSLLGTLKTIVLSSGFLLLSATVSFAVDTEGMPQAPVPGELTMVDLGAKGSIKVTKKLFVLLVDSLRTK